MFEKLINSIKILKGKAIPEGTSVLQSSEGTAPKLKLNMFCALKINISLKNNINILNQIVWET